MRQSLKIALSLLISVVLLAVFAILAFTNLFSILETGFFQPRVRAEVISRLDSAAFAVGAYHDRNLERFRVAADSTGARGALLAASPAEDLRALDEAVMDLQGQVAALTNVRIVEAGKNLIHYSRLPSDVRETAAERTAYKRLAEADGTVAAELLGAAGGSGTLLTDGSRNRFIYVLPVGDGGATALFYVDAVGLSTELLRVAAPVGKGVSTLADLGVLLDASTAERDAIRDSLATAIRNLPGAKTPFDVPLTVDVASGGTGTVRSGDYQAFAVSAPRSGGGDWGLVVRLEPRSSFEMSRFFKYLLLASFFVTVFLLTYLLFNLRPDPLDVVSQRVKRFQVQLLESLLEREGTTDWGRWRSELEGRRGELTRQVQRGIGRVSKGQQPEIDALVDKGWNEILDLLAQRAGTAPAPAALDVSRLENLIQQALKSASFVVPAQIIGPQTGQPARPATGPAAVERGRPIEVEELRAEEVEDLPEAESVEDIPEASLEEPVAEVAPLTEAEEAAEAGLAAAAGAVAEAEEAAEVEEVAEAEEVAGAAEAAEVGAAAEVEEAAEVEDLEELVAAGPEESAMNAPAMVADMPGELSIPVAETLEESAPATAPVPGAAGRPAADPFLDALEELEAVTEIAPLPPLPEEEGLEMLLPADDGGSADQPRTARGRRIAGSGPAGPADVEPSDDFEELEMLEEAIEPGEESLSEDDQRQEIERLIASGGIRTWTIEKLRKATDEARSAIVVENGVFRIKDEVYSASARGSGRLKRIADEVIGHEPRARAGAEPSAAPAGEADSETGFSGIVDLMRDAEPLDLFKVVGADRESAAEPAPVETGRSKTLTVKRNGLDYDEFLAAYPRSFSHTTQMKSLVEVSRRVSAVSAGLLLKKADGWSPDLTIGFSDRTLAGLNFRKGEPFGTLLLGKRLTVAIDRPPGEIKTIRVRIDPEDLRYAKRILLLPATFRGQEAYLLFAFATDSDILLENVLSSMQVQ